MRVTRRTWVSSPASAAAATSGVTAKAKPDPIMNTTKNSVVAIVAAASAATSYQPSIIVSVIWIANCAIFDAISGKPSLRIARR